VPGCSDLAVFADDVEQPPGQFAVSRVCGVAGLVQGFARPLGRGNLEFGKRDGRVLVVMRPVMLVRRPGAGAGVITGKAACYSRVAGLSSQFRPTG